MTTVEVTMPTRARNVLFSEWIKLRSVRSTYLVLLFGAAAAVGIGYLVAHADATHWATMTAAKKAAFDPVYDSFSGLGLAQLAFGAFGLLAISSEYTTGLIRTTFAAAPRRRAVIRHTAGAITAMVGVVFLLPTVIHALPAPWDTRIGRFTLDGAAQQMIAHHPQAGYFPAGLSFLIVATYAAVAIAAAAFMITRRDA